MTKRSRHPMELLKTHRREARFILLFLVFYLALNGFHYLTRSATTPILVDKMTAAVCSKIINIVDPAEKTIAYGNVFGSGSHRLSILPGCDGTDGFLVLAAAVLAFEMGWLWKVSGLALGGLAVYIVNLLRVILLYYTYKYNHSLFDIMHAYVGQSMVILAGVIFFILWAAKAKKGYHTPLKASALRPGILLFVLLASNVFFQK